MEVTVLHADHGISDEQQAHVNAVIAEQVDGFFIRQVEIPAELGTVPCGLHGPAMGDEPVLETEVERIVRFSANDPRTWADRMIDRPTRPVGYVQVIGVRDGEAATLFTVYGGPLAPQNPDDPDNHDADAAREFWAAHALSK